MSHHEIFETGLSLWYDRALTVMGLGPEEARARVEREMAGPREHLARLREGEPQGDAGQALFQELPLSEPCARPELPGIQQVVWIGLGGSVLGPQMLVQSLGGGGLPIHFVDTLDPHQFAALSATLDPSLTHYVLASKSGSTAETIMLGGWILGLLEQRGLQLDKHLSVVSGPSGSLTDLAQANQLPHYTVPEGVGGRWSVLSPIGLLAASIAGVDLEELLAGARQVEEAGATETLAWLYAEALAEGTSIFPFVVYDDRLATFGDWVQQLLMESLGKRFDRAGNEVRKGLTVIATRGTGAQHSMFQEWIDGPPGKFFSFLLTGDVPSGPELGGPLADHPSLAPLAGRTPREVQVALYQGTADSLMAAGRPSVSLHVKRVDARSVGALIYLFELVCAMVADALDVNAFDQPGVERGKHLAADLLEGLERGDPIDPESEIDRLLP